MLSFSKLLRIRFFSRSFCNSPPISELTNTALKSIINDLFQEQNLQNLVQKFKKFSEIYRFRCKHRIYEVAVRRLASAKQFESIEQILEEQKKYKECSTEGFVIRLISLYGKSGMFDHALKTFYQMPDLNCNRTVKSFNALLTACVDSKNFDEVSKLFRELPTNLSLKPDIFSYNIVIRTFCEMGSLDSAFSVLEEMEKNGVNPNLITFNTLLNRFYGGNRFSDAEKIWVLMEKYGCDPDTLSFNAKMRGLIREGRTSEAVKLFEELKCRGLKPDTFSFNALIKGYCDDGNLEDAKRIYGELAKNDCLPNRWSLETLIPCLCENKDFDMAVRLCKDSINHRCYVDIKILQGLVDGLRNNSMIKEAKEIEELWLGKINSGSSLNLPDNVA